MSTILDTLKKLEEEKSVLDQNINLKGLMLQSERALYPRERRERSGQGKILISLMLGGIVLGIAIGYYFNRPASEEPPATASSGNPGANDSAQSVPPSTPLIKTRNRMGIKLAHIPEQRAESRVPEPVEPTPQRVSVPAEAPSIETVPFAPIPELPEAPSVSGIEESASPFFVSDPQPGLVEDRITEEDIAEDSAPGFSKPITKMSLDELIPFYIPGVKVKGIIFFGPGHKSNHVLVSTPKTTKRTLRVGDTLNGAVLKDIRPSASIFSYKGQLAKLAIGE